MIPMLLKMKIPRNNKPALNLYLPLFIAWLILLFFLLLLLPFILLGAFILWATGYGRLMLVFILLIFSLLWNLKGLKIDIEETNNRFFMSFI